MLNIGKSIKLSKRNAQLLHGVKKGLIIPYPDSLFDRLRPYHLAGFPASIALFVNELCNGLCYDRSMLMQLAFKDARVVHADIETLRITAGDEHAEHSFVETTDFGDGKTWVVDTSMGMIFEKNYYYKMEKPKINKVYTKDECLLNPSVMESIVSDFNNERYILPMILPFVEAAVNKSNHIHTALYRKKLIDEIANFKKAVNYDAIKTEVDEDIRMMRTNPDALDKKFGIVRDRHGREISRNGIPNPYYISPEQADAQNAYFESIKHDKQKMKEYLNNICKSAVERMELEDANLSAKAKVRLEEILQNPTMDYYISYNALNKPNSTITSQ